MKTNNKFLWFLTLTTILISCSKSTTIVEDNEISIDLNKQYIQFDSGVTTRGALVTKEFLDENFAVLGYQYRGTWETAKVMANPNVFYNTNGTLALPQLVTYGDGIYTYAPIQAWTGNTYSFFGYYPSSHSSIKLFDNGASKEGVPYITYTVPSSADPRDLIDIMTASYIDTNIDISPDVRIHMRHRLSAIDICARNYYIHKITEVDETTGAETTTSQIVTIEITSLVLAVETFTGAKIYLDGRQALPSEYIDENTPKTTIKEYQFVGGGNLDWSPSTLDIMPNSTEDTSLRLITTSEGENATSILLIPQSNSLKGNLVIKYKKKYENDGIANYIGNEETVTVDLSTFSRSLVEGRRYYIEITFTSDAVSVNIIAADEWDEINQDDLKHEFE